VEQRKDGCQVDCVEDNAQADAQQNRSPLARWPAHADPTPATPTQPERQPTKQQKNDCFCGQYPDCVKGHEDHHNQNLGCDDQPVLPEQSPNAVAQ
jgi:hypothetical protein